ncbi:MAG: YggS family pyridoxal phosphate-dependent enzyme [Acidobacteria bacterium]|nr:YggS family pyridoxal phosphate-dependent enzyme [Acidobacteriota bacterium]MBU1338478.1 YggS family pyridoxal phosphate-dependent enzyme [Acidobacteriota bacterium]MBU1474758.1 YggS family pyridoxal phosphate-dependent enzyme [Acidobacteriota bacterium]MBU2437572.1 YggS family pyridoxal phosphate-dependent enzyme [Acidobacteriota bacterium]MBU4254248.1 YggS family pyridoxal phosphate-dependent enzyme [Acidobacteriota bacterium]
MINDNVKTLLKELPANVTLVAAAKARTPAEILQAAEAGIQVVGENYVQEAEEAYRAVGHRVRWHFIGQLQKNKVQKAVKIFDMIETVDSFELAEEIEKRAGRAARIMNVLIEINSGREPQKAGVLPEEAEELIRKIARLQNIHIKGLMTMGPFTGDPEDARPYFIETRKLFEKIKAAGIPRVEMEFLSMGMTNSYQVAIEEGANIVRIGTKIFGER